jgi:hypothetical protein
METLQQPNGLVCQLPECEKELVGQQKKYCSRRHKRRAVDRRRYKRLPPNGFLCRFPGCGKALVGKQKSYCSAVHMYEANIDKLIAFHQTERAHFIYQKNGRRTLAMHPELSFKQRPRYRGIVLPLDNVERAAEIRAKAPEIRQKQHRQASLTKRLNCGGLLCCPHCGSRDAQRRGKNAQTGKRNAQCSNPACRKYWTIDKDYTSLLCPRCGSENTKKSGYAKDGTPLGQCKDCKQRKDGVYHWTIGKDYGTPFTPAQIDLLRTAREMTWTPEEDAQAADILGSAPAEE